MVDGSIEQSSIGSLVRAKVERRMSTRTARRVIRRTGPGKTFRGCARVVDHTQNAVKIPLRASRFLPLFANGYGQAHENGDHQPRQDERPRLPPVAAKETARVAVLRHQHEDRA